MVRNSGFHYTLPYTLTLKNLLRVYPRIPVYCLIHCHTQSRLYLEWEPIRASREYVQKEHDVGSLRHAPFTNSEKLHRVKN